MTIITAMLQRKGKTIQPEDVAVAVLSQGADETRAELVRLMAASYAGFQSYAVPKNPRRDVVWTHLAWVIEETARTA